MPPKQSDRKYDYLKYILLFWKQKKRSPVIRDISDHFNTSTSVVSYFIDRLTEDGLLLEKEFGESRAIVPTEIANAIDAYFEKA